MTDEAKDPQRRALFGINESLEAIDQVLGAAQRTLRIFDVTLGGRGLNTPARAERLRELVVSGRSHRILIALHDPDALHRDNARLLALLRQFPMSIEIHRTLGQARNASDPFILADDHSVWRQPHHEQPRSFVALHSPQDALPLLQRFEEIWELSEPAVSATTLGL